MEAGLDANGQWLSQAATGQAGIPPGRVTRRWRVNVAAGTAG
jgi:hypothetical protein